jgi:tetratricopeptide (TPR) repeat protein
MRISISMYSSPEGMGGTPALHRRWPRLSITGSMSMSEFDYDAFISYRRSDGAAVAQWLRRALVGYRLPLALRSRHADKLRVYLDTVYERATSDFYERNIKPALQSSRFLIVVATPDAMRRPRGVADWIDREIHDFTRGQDVSNVIAVRGAGEFDGPLPGDLKQLCPGIEIVDLRGAGRFWFLSVSRIARLNSEKLKIIAPLCGIPSEDMPTLRQEQERRQQTRTGAIAGAVLGVMLAVSALSVFSLISRYQAIRAHDDSMFAAGSMIDEARSLGSSDPDTARTRRLIIGRGCDLLDQADQGAGNDPPVGAMVACRLERAAQRESFHEDKDARRQFEDAIALADLSHQKRSRVESALALLQARQAYAEYLTRQKDVADSDRTYAELLQDAQKLESDHTRPDPFARFVGEADGQIGDRQAANKDHQGAADSYDAAAIAVERWLKAVKDGLRSVNPEGVVWLVRLHRLAGLQYLELKKADEAIMRFGRALDARKLQEGNGSPSIDYETAWVYASMFLIERERGNTDAAKANKQESLKSIELVTGAANVASEIKQRADNLKRSIEQWDH